jgi:hypothetical protein
MKCLTPLRLPCAGFLFAKKDGNASAGKKAGYHQAAPEAAQMIRRTEIVCEYFQPSPRANPLGRRNQSRKRHRGTIAFRPITVADCRIDDAPEAS